MSSHVLCQINIAPMHHDLEHPSMKDFVDALDAINALAEAQPGFVWRFKGDDSDETSPWPDTVLPNMSVWKDIDALMTYVYRTDHTEYLKRKKEWFKKMDGPHLALWWAPEGHIPTLAEGKEKLELLKVNGPGPDAFTLGRRFDAPVSVAGCP